MKGWEPFQDIMREGHQRLKQALNEKQISYNLYMDLTDIYLDKMTDAIMTMYKTEQNNT